MNKIINFAYGSNMLYERIFYRVGKVKQLGTYTLKDWKLIFNAGGKFGTYANIEPAKGESVEGVLYELENWQMKVLDRFEFVPFNYLKYKFHTPSGVTFYAYVGNIENLNPFKGKPLLDYINILIRGALENKLYYTYNKLIDFKNQNYKLKGNKYKKYVSQ